MTERVFNFAWVDAGEAFNSVTHAREDEKIIRFKIAQNETEFATLEIDVRNPKIGLLSTGRKVWAWLSWNRGGGTVTKLFFGRLVGIPSSITNNVVTLQFIARPSDFAMQKEALAGGMRELPYYDPIFVQPENRTDPDVVLEARTEVWHIDRTSGEVTVSDLLIGEDGVEEFQDSEVPYDSVTITLVEPPIRTVHVEASVPWVQSVSGHVFGWQGLEIDTPAGKGLVDSWPKAGASLGGGWSVYSSAAQSRYESLSNADFAAAANTGANIAPLSISVISSLSTSVNSTDGSSTTTYFAILDDSVFTSIDFAYKAQRQRKDTLVFDLIADSQPVLTLPEDAEQFTLQISAVDVSQRLDPLDEYSEVPIGTSLRRSYFQCDRGQQSIKYLLALARANIIVRSRAIKISFKCSLARAVECTLRKNAIVHDSRLPGGQALGKITSMTMMADGGEISGTIEIACSVGYGGSVTTSLGSPTCCEDDCLEYGIQERTGEIQAVGTGDIGYEIPPSRPNDDGLFFPLGHPPYLTDPHVVTLQTKGLLPKPAQLQDSVQQDDCGNTTSISSSMTLDTGPYNDWLGGVKSTVDFVLAAVEGGPFETTYQMTTTTLKLPKQIDLEAPTL